MAKTSQFEDVRVIEDAPVSAGPRSARLRVRRLEPWSVMKTSFVLSLGLGIILIVAMMLVWLTLSSFGVFDSINKTIADIAGSSSKFDISEFVAFNRVIGYALLLAAFEVVMTSVLSTLVAAIYNVTTALTGGFELTLAED